VRTSVVVIAFGLVIEKFDLFLLTLAAFKPNFPRGRAKRLILLEPAAECSHKLFHISLDTAELQ
jgi:hypothetical protein